MPLSVCLSAIGRGIVLDTKEPERLLTADCVEKVGPSRLPAFWLLKTPFLRAATRDLSLEPSAHIKDFNLKRVLFCRGNHGRLFQHNRPKADLAIRMSTYLV